MKRKRDIQTGKVNKYKARLNVNGGKQEYQVNYWETYSPVVTWMSVRLMLILSIIKGWKIKQIEYVLAYPKSEIE